MYQPVMAPLKIQQSSVGSGTLVIVQRLGGSVKGGGRVLHVQVTKNEKGSSVTWISVGHVQIGNSGK